MSYRLKGINDEHDTCVCCGKTGLKRVMWLAPLDSDGNETADPSPYGTTCGALKLQIKTNGRPNREKVELAAWAQLREKVYEKIDEISKNWIVVQGCKFPAKLYGMSTGRSDAIEKRNKEYPLFALKEKSEFHYPAIDNGKVLLEAARYI